ncbi:hypothetical protein O6H91_21G064500 [Diphasiastrum complanatum]|uniref:Uncharacterized protein n=1 Tax=Diphasiastrum complanatum TaxID=34168 RepID=A0ACC2ALH1_DIPCM|nr:hypothetical protein O6H91_21G064500 [Diphasiastrum complanatum]
MQCHSCVRFHALQPWLGQNWQKPTSVCIQPPRLLESPSLTSKRNACDNETCRLNLARLQVTRKVVSCGATSFMDYGAEKSSDQPQQVSVLHRLQHLQHTASSATSLQDSGAPARSYKASNELATPPRTEQDEAGQSGVETGTTMKNLHMVEGFVGSYEASNERTTPWTEQDKAEHCGVETGAMVKTVKMKEGKTGTDGGFLNKEDEVVEVKGSLEPGKAYLEKNGTTDICHGGLNEEIEHYEPKIGDEVMGVVVSGTDKRIDIDIGADMLGYMLAKEVIPFDPNKMEELAWDIPEVSTEDEQNNNAPLYNVKIVRDQEILSMENPKGGLLDVGTVISAEVLGRTLSGRPLLSIRRIAHRIAWERLRQIQEEKEPIEVQIREWNTGGLCAKIEGLRGFLPKEQFLKYPEGGILELKEQVGKRMFVCVIATDESTNKLILSERDAWVWRFLHPGCLLEGTVTRLYSFGAVVKVDGSGISGLLHISNISKVRVSQVRDVLSVDEKIKAIVVPSPPDKLSFSTAELESEQGLMLQDKQRVFREAETMAKMIRKTHNLESRRLAPNLQDRTDSHVRKNGNVVANLEWLEFMYG